MMGSKIGIGKSSYLGASPSPGQSILDKGAPSLDKLSALPEALNSHRNKEIHPYSGLKPQHIKGQKS